MKKIFYLLTLLLCVVSGAWAQNTIYSWEGAAEGAIQNGGTIKSYATDGGDETTDDINQTAGSFYYFRLRGKNDFSTNVVKVTLDTPLASGDKIKVTAYRNKDASGKTSGFKAKFDKGNSIIASANGTEFVNIHQAVSGTDEYSDTPNTCTFDVPADAAGSTVITMTRSHTSTNLFVTKLEIVRTDTRPTVSLTFSDATASATIGETVSVPNLTIDPAAAASEVKYSSSKTSVAIVDEVTGTVTLVGGGTTVITAEISGSENYRDASASYTLTVTDPSSTEAVVGYTEAINGTKLDARVLTGADNITISAPIYGSNITDYKGTSKDVFIDGTTYNSTDSWRKSKSGIYDGQNVGYTLTIASGYKMNVSHVSARIAVADDTYNWYVEILNGAGVQVWRSGEKTSKKTGTSGVVDADVTDKTAIQGLTGDVTVNLYVKQGGSTKYFSINYLQLTVETEVDSRSTYAMSVSSNDDTMGTVTPADGSEVTEGESVAFTATPNTEYRFVKWVIDGVDQTANPYVIENVNATHTAVAYFAKRYTVSYDLGDYTGTLKGKALCNVQRGNGIDEVYSDDADNYTIPAYAHKYLYREGYIFDKWQDGDDNTYNSGDVIAMTKDITLTPTWKATSQALSESCTENVVTWSFAKANIIFVDWQSNDNYGYYVQSATVNGEEIAVPMSIVKGKVANYTRTDAIAQTNQNTTFTIPAVSGMIIEIANAYTAFSSTTIAGSTDYTKSNSDKTITYTYTGSDATIDIVVGENNQYLNTIKVTYPVNLYSVTKTITDAGYATFCSKYPLDFSGSGVEAYIATMDGTTVRFTKVDDVPANTGVLLKGEAGEKTFTVAPSTTDVSANKLVGVLANTEVEGSIFVLMNVDDVVGFYKTTAEKFTVGANTAYLPANVVSSARSFISIDGDETTGIAEVEGIAVEQQQVYDLQGRRVSESVIRNSELKHGLYIVNGRKVMVK